MGDIIGKHCRRKVLPSNIEVEQTLKKQKTYNVPVYGPRRIVYTKKRKTETSADTLESPFNRNTDPDDEMAWKEYIENKYNNITNQINKKNRINKYDKIQEEIQKLRAKKAPGVDNSTNKHIKETPLEYHAYLSNLINAIFTTKHFPPQWNNLYPKPNKSPLFT